MGLVESLRLSAGAESLRDLSFPPPEMKEPRVSAQRKPWKNVNSTRLPT